jgi:hypothetical protein
MKKIFVLCNAIFLLAFSAKAQTFAFFRGDAPLANNTEFTVSKTSIDEFGGLVIESGLSLKNLSALTVEARAVQTTLIIPPNESYGVLNFCFERCQEGNGNQAQTRNINPNFLMVPPEFHLCFFPFEYTIAKVKYEVFPTNNPADRVSVTVTYDYNANSVGITDILDSKNTIKASQEGNYIQFSYSFDSRVQLEIYDLIGRKVAHYLLPSEGPFVLPEKLPKGIYIYTVKTSNKPLITRKILVK